MVKSQTVFRARKDFVMIHGCFSSEEIQHIKGENPLTATLLQYEAIVFNVLQCYPQIC